MHLPEFGLLVLTTIAAIAAGLAMLASKYSIARVLLWIAGLSFGSLGVLWSASSEGYSLPTQLIVAGAVGAVAAVGLTWAIWEIRLKEKAEQSASAASNSVSPKPATADIVRHPTPPTAPSPGEDLHSGPSYMKIAPGALVDGLLIKGGNASGLGTVFDVGGTLSHAHVEGFNTSSNGPGGGHGSRIFIERADSRPPDQRGPVRPITWPPIETNNADGTITAMIPFTIDNGLTLNLEVGLGGKNLIDYEILRDGKIMNLAATQNAQGFSLRTIEGAHGSYQIRARRSPGEEKLGVQFQILPSTKSPPIPLPPVLTPQDTQEKSSAERPAL
ncbi:MULTISPECIES: hypothetical protein [unclassified Bradyrhizobium]|uniref:hypothetical protein n=1 Tax=unclassified Bradyrhizobium TaxID=2631580 RepID=UPI002915E433|nr:MULTISPECIES: hypothetical protein [unclassified Bradyrhizobium]